MIHFSRHCGTTESTQRTMEHIESPEVDPHSQLIFDERVKTIQWSKGNSSASGTETT